MVWRKKQLPLQYYLSYTCSQTCNVTGFCHCFLSLETALDKVRASQPVLPWLPGPQLCVVGHIKAFTQDRQKGGLSERGKMCTKWFDVKKKKQQKWSQSVNKLEKKWKCWGTSREKENLSRVWVNRAIWLSIIRDADDCRPVIEIPKANIDSSWSRHSFGLWHKPLLHYFLPRLFIRLGQMDYSLWKKKKRKKKETKKKQRREKITGGLTVGKGLEGRLMTCVLEMKKQDTNSAIR